MALDFNHNLANIMLDVFDTELPNTAILELRSGAPAGAQSAAGGSVICSLTLGASPWLAASNSVKDINADLVAAASASGTIGHFRMKNAGDTRRIEGTVGTAAADLIVDNTSVNSGQTVTVNAFALTIS